VTDHRGGDSGNCQWL